MLALFIRPACPGALGPTPFVHPAPALSSYAFPSQLIRPAPPERIHVISDPPCPQSARSPGSTPHGGGLALYNTTSHKFFLISHNFFLLSHNFFLLSINPALPRNRTIIPPALDGAGRRGYGTFMPALDLLSAQHHAVILDLASGLSLEESCTIRGLPVTKWRKIAQGSEFQRALAERQQSLIKELEEDAAIAMCKKHKVSATQTLLNEMENEQASSSERQAAAKHVLALAGIQPRNADVRAQPTVVINITAEHLDAIAAARQPVDLSALPQDITAE